MLPLAPVVPVSVPLDPMGAPAPLVPVSRPALPGAGLVPVPVPIVSVPVVPVLVPVLPAPVPLVPVLLLPVLPLPAPMVPVFAPGAVLEGGVSTPALSAPGYVVPLWASTTPQEAVKARLASEVRKRGDRIMSGTP
jgi:signal-induced proliferation-associated 1 like protein 3